MLCFFSVSFIKLAREIRGVMLRLFTDPTQEKRFVTSRSRAMQRATGSVDRREAPPNSLKFHGQ